MPGGALRQRTRQRPVRELTDGSGLLRERHEDVRQQQPAGWVMPADESLDTGEVTGAGENLRLVVED